MTPTPTPEKRVGFKLLRRRTDGTLGPLFINKGQRIDVGVEYPYENHPTLGYKVRPGWHVLAKPEAPHLSTRNRVWCRVEFTPMAEYKRPAHQGGEWFLGSTMKIVEVLS